MVHLVWISSLGDHFFVFCERCFRRNKLGKVLIVHIVTVMAFILLQALVRPFKSKIVELIDMFFMLNYWIIIEVYSSFRSIFYPVYVFLTLAAILVLCFVLLYKACQSRIKKHCKHLVWPKYLGYKPANDSAKGKRILMMTFIKLLRIEKLTHIKILEYA